MSLPVHTVQSAPDAARPTLERVQKKYGFIPNLFGVLAEAPAALEAYAGLGERFAQTSLSPAAREIVLLTASRENGCGYCVAVYSTTARRAGVPAAAIDAIRDDSPIDDRALEALRRFTRAIVQKRGWLDERDVNDFLAAGYQRAQILEVLVGVTMKTLSNYVNHLAATPLDDAFKPQAWTAPGA